MTKVITLLVSIIEAIPILERFYDEVAERIYTRRIERAQGEIDESMAQRSAYLDALKLATEEKNREKVIYYRKLLASNGLQ